jgi:hypothetical protein
MSDNSPPEDEDWDTRRPMTNAVLATRVKILESKVDKLPTNSDVRVLLLLAVIANQLIPQLHIGPNPTAYVFQAIWGLFF